MQGFHPFLSGTSLAAELATRIVAGEAHQSAGEWRSLFDGKTTAGWRGYRQRRESRPVSSTSTRPSAAPGVVASDCRTR